MRSIVRLPDVDARSWSAATWAAPFTIQVVLGTVAITSWLLGKVLADVHGFALFLTSAAIGILLPMAATAVLLTSGSSRARGLAISFVGSYAVVLVGGTVYGFWVMRW